jgi:aminoglycoside phosphotransferase (APT) family kinase protein
MHVDELRVTPDLVRQLLRNQAAPWAEQALTPVQSSGTDHWLFRLGADMVVRLPRRVSAAGQMAKQHEWLPRLATALPLAVPTPIALAASSHTFPWPWSVMKWIEGEAAEHHQICHSVRAAELMGHFIRKLQRQNAWGGPPPGAHNGFRGGALIDRDADTRQCIAQLQSQFDHHALLAAWEESLCAPHHGGPPQWIHGDLLPGNLLTNHGELVAVIDFGLMAAGDPACDLMAAWTLFGAGARASFQQAVSADLSAWLRGRGWALSFAVIALPYYQALNHPLAEVAWRTIQEVMHSLSQGLTLMPPCQRPA